MNLFSYCGNAPTIYADSTGHAAETVFDVLSVGFGIAEVWNNPSDGWAWFSLAADLLDLIPFVTCLGEGTRAFRATNAMSDVVNAADNVHDSLRIIDNSTDSLTTVYRSVSKAEALDIVKTGRFNLVFGGMESKQFGLSLSETRLFGKWTGQSIIVSAKIPTKMLDKFCDIQVDPHIFKTGTITVYESQINLFNQLVEGTITFLP